MKNVFKPWKKPLGVVLAAALFGVGIACIGELTETVHFADSTVDFGAPPSPLTLSYWGEHTPRPTLRPGYDEVKAVPEPKDKKLAAAVDAIKKAYPWGATYKALPEPPSIKSARKTLDALSASASNAATRRSARGWRARIDFVQAKYGEAALAYLDLYRTSKSLDERISLLSSIRYSLKRLTPTSAKVIRKGIIARPELFEPYAEYRLYHYQQAWDEENVAKRDLAGIADFAAAVRKSNPRANLGAGITARLAEIEYARGNSARAVSLAEASLRVPNGARRDLAVYVRAGALQRLGRKAEALASLENADKVLNGSYLKRPSLELRAILSENLGDLAGALDMYRKLKYSYDVAYLVDVRMSVDQLGAYARANPDPLLRLSHGFRLLRADRLAEAEKVLAAIPEADRRKMAKVGSGDYAWLQNDSPGSTLDVIADPLTTVRDLLAIETKVNQATGEDRLAARYELASYYYTHRNLVLYNAAIWDGSRGLLSGTNPTVVTKADEDAIRKHHFEHEALYRSRQICLDIVKENPKSAVADRALYRAATASRRLANFNPWWRTYDKNGNFYTSAADLLKRVYTEHPGSPLAVNAKKYEKVYRDEMKDRYYSLR